MKNATWNKSRKSYERSPDAGHYDAIDALKYLVRNIQQNKNPYPANFGKGYGENWFNNKEEPKVSKELQKVSEWFSPELKACGEKRVTRR